LAERKLGWRSKRKLFPCGLQGVVEEIAISVQQVSLAANPGARTDRMVGTAPKAPKQTELPENPA
jgi:hypothetical protein